MEQNCESDFECAVKSRGVVVKNTSQTDGGVLSIPSESVRSIKKEEEEEEESKLENCVYADELHFSIIKEKMNNELLEEEDLKGRRVRIEVYEDADRESFLIKIEKCDPQSIKEKKEEETTLENYKHADELNFSIIKEEIKNKFFKEEDLKGRRVRIEEYEDADGESFLLKIEKCDSQYGEETTRKKYNLALKTIVSTKEKPLKFYAHDALKLFQNKDETLHIRTHLDKKRFECDVCKKTFSVKATLIEHKRIHTGEKPYECEVCRVKFTHRKSLSNHKRVHTSQKPFVCDICNVEFVRKIHLTYHMRTHTGEKTYECDICKKTYSRKGNFANHMRTHTGLKPFKSEIRKKKFFQNETFVNHLRKQISKNLEARDTF